MAGLGGLTDPLHNADEYGNESDFDGDEAALMQREFDEAALLLSLPMDPGFDRSVPGAASVCTGCSKPASALGCCSSPWPGLRTLFLSHAQPASLSPRLPACGSAALSACCCLSVYLSICLRLCLSARLPLLCALASLVPACAATRPLCSPSTNVDTCARAHGCGNMDAWLRHHSDPYADDYDEAVGTYGL